MCIYLHLTYRLRMENFYLIFECNKYKMRVYLNLSNKDLSNKFVDINRDIRLLNKFTIVIEAVKENIANKSQYNWELDIPGIGSVYAIKIDKHRFYTLQIVFSGYRELYICRYGKKESQENTKKLTDTISSIKSIEIQKILCDGK